MDLPRVTHQFADVDGVRVFYRATGPEDAPALLLLADAESQLPRGLARTSRAAPFGCQTRPWQPAGV